MINDNPFESSPIPPPPKAPMRARKIPRQPAPLDPPPASKPNVPQRISSPKGFLGRPPGFYTSEEESLITAHQQEFLEKQIDANSPFAREAIMCELEYRRIDSKLAEMDAGGNIATDTKTLKTKKALIEQRQVYWNRFTDAMKRLGALKDKEAEDPALRTLAEVHLRYRKVLDEMRKNGVRVGEPDQEERDLARSEGLNPDRYITKGSLSDKNRENVLNRNEDEPPPEEDEE